MLNARSATIILLGYLAAKVFCGVLIEVIAAVSGGMEGIRNQGVDRMLEHLIPPLLLPMHLLGVIVAVEMSFALIPNHLRDNSPCGAAWVRGSWSAIAQGLFIGLIIAACTHALSKATQSHVPYGDLGPVQRMAYTPGLPRLIWAVGAVVLAPPVEELLCRGVLYGGYRKSFGPAWAAVSTTLIFVALHLPDSSHLPKLMVTSGVALAALWCRLRSQAIGPAIAVHVGYNTFITSTVFLS